MKILVINPKHQMILIKLYNLIQIMHKPILIEAIYMKNLVINPEHQMTLIKQSDLIQIMHKPIIIEATTINLNILGKLYENIGDKSKALNDLNQAIQLNPNYAQAYSIRGNLYEKLGDKSKALNDYNQAIRFDPNNELSYINRGFLYQVIGQIERALFDYYSAIQLNPKYSQAYLNRGNIYKCILEIERAIYDFNQAIQLDPKNPKPYTNRGLLYSSFGEKEQALNDFNQAIKLNPIDAKAFVNRGNLYNSIGQNERALNDYNKAILLDPKWTKAYFIRGNLSKNFVKKEKPLNDLNQAIQLDQKDAIALTNRGYLYQSIGENEKAFSDYNKAIQIDPKYAKAYCNRGYLYQVINQNEKALYNYNQAIQIDPKDSTGYLYRGVLYSKIGQKEQLLSDYLQALSHSPNHPLILYNLGNFYFLVTDQDQQALEYLQKADNSLQSLSLSEIKKLLLSEKNIYYLKTQIDILKGLVEQILESKRIVQNLPTVNSTLIQIVQNYEKKIQDIKNEISPILSIPITQTIKHQIQIVQNNQLNQILQNVKKFKQELLQDYAKAIKDKDEQETQLNFIKEDRNILIHQDRNQIQVLLLEFNKPENVHKITYYQSLFWRLQNFLKVLQQISTDLLQINQNAVIEYNSEKVLNIVKNTSNIGSIPYIENAFQIINAALDHAIDQRNVSKFNTRVRILNQILNFFAINPQQLEIEVQMTAICLGDQQMPNVKQRKQTTFSQTVDELLIKESSTSGLFKDIYWICGIEDTFIILSYLEKNQEKILQEKRKKLRDIFENAVKSYCYLPQNKAENVDTGCSSTCQLI
ncbi:unnamed protein product [Paramecium pentaurelia]|uniref:Tetratricopeptide repeat protein n=1 Tax=Paramecium pentaurelia TaxID=43138 RepID=A0A8S1VSN7_9CILI|nr:unnamed protein product [Paramecium pentaurelia]